MEEGKSQDAVADEAGGGRAAGRALKPHACVPKGMKAHMHRKEGLGFRV